MKNLTILIIASLFGNFVYSNSLDSLISKLSIAQEDSIKARLYFEIGSEYTKNKPDSAIKNFNYVINLADNKLDIENIAFYKASSLKSIAWVYCNIFGKYDSSIVFSNQAIDVFSKLAEISSKQINKKSNIGIAECHSILGNVNFLQGNYNDALDNFRKSLSISEELSDKKSISNCYNYIGNVYKNQGNYSQSIEYYLKAVKTFEELGDKRGIANCYGNIGNIHYYQQNFKIALDYYNNALSVFNEISDQKGKGNILICIGNSYWANKEFDQAINYFQKALMIFEELGSKPGMSFCYNNIGLISKSMKDYNQALFYYEKSEKICSEIGDKSSLALIYNNYAEINTELKKYKEAIENAFKSIEISKQIGLLLEEHKSYASLSQCFDSIGDIKNSYKYFKLYTFLKDSLFDKEKNKQLTEMESKYQSEKKQKEIELLNKDKALKDEEIKKQTILKNSFIIGFSLILILALIIFRSYKQKKKANYLLSQKNTEIEQQKEEILAQSELLAETNSQLISRNSEIEQQKEEIQAQAEHLETINKELEKLSIVASETENSVVIANEQGTIEWVNEGFTKLYGYTFEEFVQVKGSNLIKASSNEHFLDAMMECSCNKKSVVYISETQNKNNRKLYIQTTLTPILDEHANIKKFVAIDTDITKLKEAEEQILREQEKSENLLLNILPVKTAVELKETGRATPRYYSKASVLFTDFKGFTMSCEKLSPEKLVEKLHSYFEKFDEITSKYGLEKIKTIGDAYMCAGGIPDEDDKHVENIVRAALEIQEYMLQRNNEDAKNGFDVWKLRLGIHTGELITGVVGKKKFAYDVWGDTVNVASRMESSGEPGKVNISETTYELVKEHFLFTSRGMIEAKNKGKINMYFVDGIIV